MPTATAQNDRRKRRLPIWLLLTVCGVAFLLLTLLIEVYAPRTMGAAGCEEAAEAITQAMMTALPEGLKLKTIQWGKAGWDKTAGMFRLEANAKYAAYFVAEAAEDETVFTDFVLKGTVKERE